MARSDVKTWLSLDEWAAILGIHPLHWNGLASTGLTPKTVCGQVFFQYSWQHADRVGRDDIAMAIQQAEMEIAAEVGFNLMPDWTTEERLTYPQPAVPGVYNVNGLNPRGQFVSVELRKGHLISGGFRVKTAIQIGAAYVRADLDNDGFAETCTATVATTVTDTNEIHLYYPGMEGVDGWEIRPIQVKLSGGNAIINFKIWQISAANEMDSLDPQPLDAEDVHSYEANVDVYRVYNSPSQQVQFLWENDPNCCGSCTACQFGTQYGCFHMRDARIGIVVPTPATWDAAAQTYATAEWSVCRAPEQVRVWYYSGYQDRSLLRPKAEMAKFWQYAVAFYAASKLDRPVCGCNNVQQFIEKWRTNVMANDQESISVNVTPEILGNKLGTTLGGIYAWKRVHQNGMRVIK